jgi:hypothetical protein
MENSPEPKNSTELLREMERNQSRSNLVWFLFGIGIAAVQWLGFKTAKDTEFIYELWLAAGGFLILERLAIGWINVVVLAIKEMAAKPIS